MYSKFIAYRTRFLAMSMEAEAKTRLILSQQVTQTITSFYEGAERANEQELTHKLRVLRDNAVD